MPLVVKAVGRTFDRLGLGVGFAALGLAGCDLAVDAGPLEARQRLANARAAAPFERMTSLNPSPVRLSWTAEGKKFVGEPLWSDRGWRAPIGRPIQLVSGELGAAVTSKPLQADATIVRVEALAGAYWTLGVHGVGKGLLGDRGEAYVAKFDIQGARDWERRLGPSRVRVADGASPYPDGGAIVAGRQGVRDHNWIARFRPDGREAWRRHFGVGKAVATGRAAGDFYVAGLELSAGSSTHQDVVLYRIDRDGQAAWRQVVRERLYWPGGIWSESVELISATDGVYLVSGGYHPKHPAPMEVARIGRAGVTWSRRLEREHTPPHADDCGGSPAADDLLLACSVDGKVTILKLARDGDVIAIGTTAMPDCLGEGLADMRMDASRWPVLLIGGARPASNVRAGCAWIGSLVVSER